MDPIDGDALGPDETASWRSFLTWSERVMSNVERELVVGSGLSAADFQILARLEEIPGNTLGQKELRDALSWTATRLSHQLTRMEDRGHVTRASAGIGRRMLISLTEDGHRAYRAALPVHGRAVRHHFFSSIENLPLPSGRGSVHAP